MTQPTTKGTEKSAAERKKQLAQAVQAQVVQGGRIESQSDFQAVIIKGKPVNHVLHLILTLVTFSFWLWVWIALAIFAGEKKSIVSVDEYGNVLVQKV